MKQAGASMSKSQSLSSIPVPVLDAPFLHNSHSKYKHDRGPSWSLLVLACALTAIVSSLAGSYTSYALTRDSIQSTRSNDLLEPSTYSPTPPTQIYSESRVTRKTGTDAVVLYSPKASLLSRYADLIGPSSRRRDTGGGGGNGAGSRGGNHEADWVRRLVESAKVNGSAQNRNGSMVVLVTGAAGFIGSHLALALKAEGHGVVGLDNFNDYYDTALKEARAARLWSAGIEIIRGDLNNGTLLDALFGTVTFTHVAHMAAQAGVRYALENPSSYVDSNVAGFVNLLERCRRVPVRQPAIVWASSSSVYGVNREVPFSETHRTERPASLYAATKLAGESIAHSYNHIHGLSLTALRFFTVYGPWGRPDMAYFFFTKNILDGKAIDVYMGANGTLVSRDFTYIDDIIKGCVSALETATPSTGVQGKKTGPAQLRVLNLGNTQPVSVPQLVDYLQLHLQENALKRLVQLPHNGDVPFTHANVSRAEQELGYHPTVGLKEGLQRFVSWYLRFYRGGATKQAEGEKMPRRRARSESGGKARFGRDKASL
ncbi:hypothetical protein CLOM_g12844 [Closterium sp. NIES-68]|nr:hypothetical protein CLOM_g12844 [Closterium sp. NIES-68]GJP66930.1 hypothetical protein CLOP_g23799 [Closterium sp. NIES-67]